MADVNGLKLTNDAFGHKTGDLLLQKISDIMKKECRINDIIARIGGDEFVLLLPQTDAKNAEIIIDRINTAIKNENIHNIIMSVSMGYAVKENNSDDMEAIFMQAEDNMYRCKLTEGSSMRSRSIDIIMNSLYEKYNREMLHSQRVGEICSVIAEKMGFTKDEVDEIKAAGQMHDIGKIGITDTILNKPGKLNIGEWNEIERHSEIGYRILGSVHEFAQIANYVLEHHEKWDGTGYPKGLERESILLKARIIAVACAYDAMTTDMPYRKALTEDEGAAELRRCAGTQFDPEVVKVFTEKVLKKLDH
jgi:diguanylate cyclase (GGDEF)-like protein